MIKELKRIIGPALTVDVVAFTVKEDNLCILLLKLEHGRTKNKWVLPGCFVGLEEKLSETAKRALSQKANININYLEQLYTFGDNVERDTRGRVVSTGYFALVDYRKFNLKTTEGYSDINWFPIDNLPEIGYDHKEIIEKAIIRIRNKIQYSNIACHLLPRYFTLSSLQKVYEAVLGRSLDKRNFRKKVLSIGVIRETKEKEKLTTYRPPKLYKFVSKKHKEVELV